MSSINIQSQGDYSTLSTERLEVEVSSFYQPPLKKIKQEHVYDYSPITSSQYQEFYQNLNYWPTPPN
jgi:hypothetical protein